MMGFFTSLIAGAILLLIAERSEESSCFLVKVSVRCLPKPVQEQRLEQWTADVVATQGGLWKLITAIGVVWTCRTDIVERLLNVRFEKKYAVVEYPFTGKSPSTVMWRVKESNPCGLVVIGLVMLKIEEDYGAEGLEEFKAIVLRNLDKKKGLAHRRKPVESDKAYFTNVPPIDVDIVLGVVDGRPTVVSS